MRCISSYVIYASALIIASGMPAWAAPDPSDMTTPPSSSSTPGSVEEPDMPDEMDSTPLEKAEPAPPHSTPAAKTPPAATTEAPAQDGFQTVVLRVLNKVTARTQEIEAPVGSVMRSGTIEIIAHTCWQSLPDQPPENAAFLEISEVHQGEAPQRIFLGWMFSSSPAISSLEHPFYDVTVLRCQKSSIAQ